MINGDRLLEIEDIAPDIETANRLLVQSFELRQKPDDRSQMTFDTYRGAVESVLRDRLFKATLMNPNLGMKLFVGQTPIAPHEVTFTDLETNRSDSNSGIAKWSSVDLSRVDGMGRNFYVGNDRLRLKFGTVLRTVGEGGRIVVIDDSPIVDDDSSKSE